MESKASRPSEPARPDRPTGAGIVPAEARAGSPAPPAERSAHPESQTAAPATSPPSAGQQPGQVPRAESAERTNSNHSLRKWLILGSVTVGLAVACYYIIPMVLTMLNTVSTDDAYVNGHVTFVAPRVAGQVKKVLVDNNNRVKKGSLLVQLDKEPFLVQVGIKKAAVEVAETNLETAQAQVRAQVAQARANRFKLEHAIEDVKTQIANLRASVATLKSKQATLKLAQANLKRGEDLAPSGGISKEELDQRRQAVKVEEAAVEQAQESIYAIRAGLGLPAKPVPGHELTTVPADLDQTFSVVRQSLADLLQSAAQFGYLNPTWDATPTQAVANFFLQDQASSIASVASQAGGLFHLWQPGWVVETMIRAQDTKGSLDRIYAHYIVSAPIIKQAEAKLLQARRDLDQAELDLRYCDIVSDIDGVVTRRNVNPGNNVQVGQSLMAVRSLTEIWIDANFKETQLADLRIGQRVRLEVDMYGSRREFEGRITGFTMGTGQTLALLPPQNATGNFVKIVQRLPVRIELDDYDPDKEPLFVGLSVVPYVYYKEPPTGPHAGEFLQPVFPLPQLPTDPKP